jgi:ABC-2 type transport system ATP-binding protein
MPAIEVEDLFKSYGPVDAVRGISFRVEEGEVFALLGPNGAGKTTTLEILEGHRRRSGGRVSVLGVDPEAGGRAFRERIGMMLQSAGIDAELTVREVLSLYAASYPRSLPVADVTGLVGLEDKHRARVRTARHGAGELIDSLRGLGRTIVLTSHYMDEVQHLADRAIVITNGRIVAEGRPDSLGRSGPSQTVISFRLPTAQTFDQLPGDLRRVVASSNGEVTIRTTEPTSVLSRLCDWALERGLELPGLEVGHPSLEDVYLQLTEGGRDGGD